MHSKQMAPRLIRIRWKSGLYISYEEMKIYAHARPPSLWQRGVRRARRRSGLSEFPRLPQSRPQALVRSGQPGRGGRGELAAVKTENSALGETLSMEGENEAPVGRNDLQRHLRKKGLVPKIYKNTLTTQQEQNKQRD